MASIFLALRNPEKLKTRFPGSLRLGRPPVELRAETNFTRSPVLPSTHWVLSTVLVPVLVPYGTSTVLYIGKLIRLEK